MTEWFLTVWLCATATGQCDIAPPYRGRTSYPRAELCLSAGNHISNTAIIELQRWMITNKGMSLEESSGAIRQLYVKIKCEPVTNDGLS